MLRLALGHGGHERALAGIAVATATRHRPEGPAALLRKRLQRLQGFFQRIRRVGVVHQNQRLARCGRHLLHAAGYRRERLTGTHRIGQRHTERAGGGQHTQQVGHVVQADQRQAQPVGFDLTTRCVTLPHGQAHAVVGEADVARENPRRV
ncbi:hypothetical protein FQZ97_1020460 [compost metagenome]